MYINIRRFTTLSLTLLLLLSACTYTYIPPVPEARTREKVFDLSSPSGLTLENERLRLDYRVDEVPEADWLAVQWFAPNNDQVASESVWISEVEGGTSTLFSPERVTLRPGTWRAVLSFRGRIVRQFATTIEE